MNFLKHLFTKPKKYYDFKFIEFDEGDAYGNFVSNDGLTYLIELDWSDGIIDVEFGVADIENYDTTNSYDQYKVLNTVSEVVKHTIKRIKKRSDVEFHTLEFKSSDWSNGVQDSKSKEIRDRFFIRYVKREYPNAIVSKVKGGVILIKIK